MTVLQPLKQAVKQKVRAALAHWRGRRRKAELRASVPHIGRDALASGLRQLLAPGDTVFIHSSLKSLGYVEGGPATVITALRDAVGPQGTLILPTYYMPGGTILATCEMADYTFDPRRHGTNMGALPEAFLATADVERSIHPTHSVSAIGPQARFITEAHHLAPSVFGTGSPWQRFHQTGGKVLGLGISMGPVTFYHLVEDTMGAAFPEPVWLDKTYRMPCLDWQGAPHKVPVRAFDPAYVQQRIDQKPRADLRDYFRREFESSGLLQPATVGQADAWTIDARAFLQRLQALARDGITIYSSPAALAARPLPPRPEH